MTEAAASLHRGGVNDEITPIGVMERNVHAGRMQGSSTSDCWDGDVATEGSSVCSQEKPIQQVVLITGAS